MVGEHPCPCCGHLVFEEGPGSFDICPVCFWEDDHVQLRWPWIGGANIPLIEAQANYMAHGVGEMRVAAFVRKADPDVDRRDPAWRPWNPTIDRPEPVPEGSYFDLVTLEDGLLSSPYYWRR